MTVHPVPLVSEPERGSGLAEDRFEREQVPALRAPGLAIFPPLHHVAAAPVRLAGGKPVILDAASQAGLGQVCPLPRLPQRVIGHHTTTLTQPRKKWVRNGAGDVPLPGQTARNAGVTVTA